MSFSVAEHYESWEQAIREFVGRRLSQPAESLCPLAVGRTVLAACQTAYDRWSAWADTGMTVYLDAVLTALAAGFAPDKLEVARLRLIRPDWSFLAARLAKNPCFRV